MLASESWFAVISLDLLHSFTNPFTSYKHNLRRYHLFVWGTALTTSLVLVTEPGAWGVTRATETDEVAYFLCERMPLQCTNNPTTFVVFVHSCLYIRVCACVKPMARAPHTCCVNPGHILFLLDQRWELADQGKSLVSLV